MHGLPRVNVSRGENIIPLLNTAGIDAYAPGNHDFNYGAKQLMKLTGKMDFAALSANIVKKNTNSLVLDAYDIFKLPNNIKVGVFGLTTPETATMANPLYVKDVDFADPVKAAQMMVKTLRPKVDLIVAVMHMGLDKNSEFTSERIAKEAPGIDVIVDGHSHTALADGMTVGNTLIVQTGWHGYRLGRVDINMRDYKIVAKKAQLLDASDVKKLAAAPDAKVMKNLTNLETRNKKVFGEVLAKSDRRLIADREQLFHAETPIGNLCADAFRQKAKADIAVINGANIRGDLPKGNVTREDMLAVFPFGNTLQKAEIKGKTVREMLEHSVAVYPKGFGGFLSVSGITFEFDPTAPVGGRVGKIMIKGKAIDENKTYKMAVNDFMLAGGDGYDMLKNLRVIEGCGLIEDAVAEYLDNNGARDITMGRIKRLKEVPVVKHKQEKNKVYTSAAEELAKAA